MSDAPAGVDAPVDVPTEAPAAVEAPAPVETPNEPAPAETPVADWRDSLTGGDAKRREAIDNYGSSEAVVDALMAAKQKIRSGDMLPKLGDNPTDDELAAYRKDHNIPESFDKYEYKLPEGFTFGEEDKPYLDKMLKGMHEKNATPDMINTMLNLHAVNIEEQAVQYQARDASQKETTEDTLRAEYGNDYRANINMVQNFLSTAPEGVQSMLLNGRGPDGTAFMNSPEMVRWMNGVTREINPAASVVKMTGRDTVAQVDSELDKLHADMSSDINAWHKAPEKKARYQELLTAKGKLDARNNG